MYDFPFFSMLTTLRSGAVLACLAAVQHVTGYQCQLQSLNREVILHQAAGYVARAKLLTL